MVVVRGGVLISRVGEMIPQTSSALVAVYFRFIFSFLFLGHFRVYRKLKNRIRRGAWLALLHIVYIWRREADEVHFDKPLLWLALYIILESHDSR